MVSRSQPDLEIGKRAVPAKYLNDKSKGESGDVKDLDGSILNSPKCTKKKKDDPKEMDHHNAICKNFVGHLSN